MQKLNIPYKSTNIFAVVEVLSTSEFEYSIKTLVFVSKCKNT